MQDITDPHVIIAAWCCILALIPAFVWLILVLTDAETKRNGRNRP